MAGGAAFLGARSIAPHSSRTVVVQFGVARLLTSRLARTLAPPKVIKRTTTCRTLFLTVPGGTVICTRCNDWNSAINDLFVVLASGEPHGHCYEHGDAADCEDRDFHRIIRRALRQAVWEPLTNQKQKLLRPATERMAGFCFCDQTNEKHQNEITVLLD